MHTVYRQLNYSPLTVHLPEESILPSADRLWARAHGQSRDYLALLPALPAALLFCQTRLRRRQVLPLFLIPPFLCSGSCWGSDRNGSRRWPPVSESPFRVLPGAPAADLVEPAAEEWTGGGA